MNRTLCIALVAVFPLAGCGSMNVGSLLPFGDGKTVERSRVPANSVTYQCAGGKRFYLRTLDNGAAAWVILPEREFRLDRLAGEAGRFGNGKAVLTIAGEEVSLSDGPTVNYTGCRIPVPQAEPAKK
jgi:hypothetical protein